MIELHVPANTTSCTVNWIERTTNHYDDLSTKDYDSAEHNDIILTPNTSSSEKHNYFDIVFEDQLEEVDVIQEPNPDAKEYFNFYANEDDLTISFTRRLIDGYFSLDMIDWIPTEEKTVNVPKGERLYIKGKGYDKSIPSPYTLCVFATSTKCQIDGDYRSLVESDTYDVWDDSLTSLTLDFTSMFRDTKITSIPKFNTNSSWNLICTNMFNSCTELTSVPSDLLPSTAVTENCYTYMFMRCRSLVNAPELPATTLAQNCYTYMFGFCNSLVTAPSILPATTLAPYCYQNMFYDCPSLVNVPSILPATALTQGCYTYMFCKCTSLVNAPELPAKTLYLACYAYMFNGCSSLNSIKVGATSWVDAHTEDWVLNVSPTGTFYKRTSLTNIPLDDTSGVPNGWTIIDY